MSDHEISFTGNSGEIWEPTNHLRQIYKSSVNSNFDILELQQLWVSNLRNTEWRSIEIVEE